MDNDVKIHRIKRDLLWLEMIDAAALSRKEFDELILVIFDIYLENVTFAMPMRAYGRVVGRAFSVVCLCLCK